MTGREGLYLPGETAGVCAAGLGDSLPLSWLENGERTDTVFSRDSTVITAGTAEHPYYDMPDTDVTLRAVGVKPEIAIAANSLTRGDAVYIMPGWYGSDGLRSDYDELLWIASIKDGDGNDVSSFVTLEDTLTPGERGTLQVAEDLPEGVDWIVIKVEGDDHSSASTSARIQIVTPEPEPWEPEEADPATAGAAGAATPGVGEPIDFPDVDDGAWYAEAVDYVSARGIMVGTGNGFEPDLPASRAMIAQLLFNLDGAHPGEITAGFSDVAGDDWYAAAVSWLVKNGIARGKGAAFGADDPVTREELVVMLYNYAAWKGRNVTARGEVSQFSDADAISPWALEAMRWAVAIGLIRGMGDGKCAPGGGATRAQIATFMMRFCETVLTDRPA